MTTCMMIFSWASPIRAMLDANIFLVVLKGYKSFKYHGDYFKFLIIIDILNLFKELHIAPQCAGDVTDKINFINNLVK